MSLIPDYANAVGSAMSYNRKAADTEILAPVAKRSSIIAVLRRVVSFSYFVVAEHILL